MLSISDASDQRLSWNQLDQMKWNSLCSTDQCPHISAYIHPSIQLASALLDCCHGN